MPDWVAPVAGLIIVAAMTFATVSKIARVNRRNPVQRELVRHMEAFARSDRGEAAVETLRASIEQELNAAQVKPGRRRWHIRAAGFLISPQIRGVQGRALMIALAKLRLFP